MGLFNKGTQPPPEATSVSYELKRMKMFGWRDVIVCLLIVAVFLLTKDKFGFGLGSYDGLVPILEETRFGITDLDGESHFFTYADAESIELFDDLKQFDMGEKVEGKENRYVLTGIYRNSAFGEYQLYVQPKLNYYIVVHAPDGVIVFNLESDGTTQELYRNFMEAREEQLST